jgi:hypothetical protein
MQQQVLHLFGHYGKRSKRRRTVVVEPIHGVVTILEPSGVEHGIFPTITRKVLKLQSARLKAQRWPASLKFPGTPFGTANMVYRRAGRWVVNPGPWQGECPYIQARVERIVIGPDGAEPSIYHRK